MKLILAKSFRLFFKQENGDHFFFENPAGEKLVGDLHQEIRAAFAGDAAPEAHREFS